MSVTVDINEKKLVKSGVCIPYLVHLLQDKSRPALNEPAEVGFASGLICVVEHETEGRGFWKRAESSQEIVGLRGRLITVQLETMF